MEETEKHFTDEEIVNIKAWDIPTQIQREKERLSEFEGEGEISFEEAALSVATKTAAACTMQAATEKAKSETGFATYDEASRSILEAGKKWTKIYSVAAKRTQKILIKQLSQIFETEEGK